VPQRDSEGVIVRWFGTNTDMDEQREQQRQKDALFNEVAQQLTESAAAFADLQQKYAKAVAALAQTKRASDPPTGPVDAECRAAPRRLRSRESYGGRVAKRGECEVIVDVFQLAIRSGG
jgi:hypothetical protein